MKFTLDIPLGVVEPDGFQSMAAIAEMAAALEKAGVDACYVTDHPAPDAAWLHQGMGHDTLDPFTALAFVAAASTRLLLHTNILVLPYRNPFLTAKAAASLQVLSGGRLILGVGAGYQKVEFEALGVDFHRRGALASEALETIRLAWSGGAVSIEGGGFSARNVEPRPVPAPPPPIWVGGGSDKAAERAARWGDGWSPVFSAPEMSAANRASGIQSVDHLREKLARLHDLRARLGRDGPFDVAIGARVRPEALTRDEADRYLESLAGLADAGVTWAMHDPGHASRAAWCEHVAWFGEEVVARATGLC